MRALIRTGVVVLLVAAVAFLAVDRFAPEYLEWIVQQNPSIPAPQVLEAAPIETSTPVLVATVGEPTAAPNTPQPSPTVWRTNTPLPTTIPTETPVPLPTPEPSVAPESTPEPIVTPAPTPEVGCKVPANSTFFGALEDAIHAQEFIDKAEQCRLDPDQARQAVWLLEGGSSMSAIVDAIGEGSRTEHFLNWYLAWIG